MVPQRHKRDHAIIDIRYTEPFFHISTMSWSDRFWQWAYSQMFSEKPTTQAVMEGRSYAMTQTKRFSYIVTSTEAYVPLLLVEMPKFMGNYEEPKFYVLKRQRQSRLLDAQIDMVEDALIYPIYRQFEQVDIDKIGQLTRAGSTAKWVANKMMGKYDGEES